MCVINLSRAAQAVELDLSAYKGYVPVELLGRAAFPPIGELPYLLTLPGHNYYWFRLTNSDAAPAWHEQYLPPEELPTLVLFAGWRSFFRERVVLWRIAMAEKVRSQLEEDVLPRFVVAQRWYDVKGEVIRRVFISDYVEWVTVDYKWLIVIAQIKRTNYEPLSYFLPLALAWENDNEERLHAISPMTIAKVRQQAQIGIIGDAFADAEFCRAIVHAIDTRQTLTCEQGIICFTPTAAFTAPTEELLSVRPTSIRDSNTTVVLGNRLFLKGYRYLQIGTHPEFEVGRFLTEVAHFSNTAPVLGVVEYQGSDGNNMTLALLQGYIANQGDCWRYTLDYLSRFLEEYRTTVEPSEAAAQVHSAYLILIHTLGQRTGELHNALSKITGDSAFDPEPITYTDLADWLSHVQAEAVVTLNMLEHQVENLTDTAQEAAKTLLMQRNTLTERLNACIVGQMKAVKTRFHGDFHLRQVLLTQNDFVFTDFDGEPTRPFTERHYKHSPLRDVAVMLRSFNYAAHTALMHVSAEQPTDLAKFELLVRDWEAEVGRVFLAAYHEVVPNSDDVSQRGLLDLFLLEKALYEVRYELDNRPNWLDIPLLGILSLLQTTY